MLAIQEAGLLVDAFIFELHWWLIGLTKDVLAHMKRYYRQEVGIMRDTDKHQSNMTLTVDSWNLVPDQIVKNICNSFLNDYYN